MRGSVFLGYISDVPKRSFFVFVVSFSHMHKKKQKYEKTENEVDGDGTVDWRFQCKKKRVLIVINWAVQKKSTCQSWVSIPGPVSNK